MPIYMKIEGIDGESHNPDFRGFFDVFSFSWGATNPSTVGGGCGAGRVQIQDVSVTKPCGKGSPKLMLACASGRHLPAVQIIDTIRRGELEEVYQQYKLSNCMITSYQVGGDGGSTPSESISLNFTKIEYKQILFGESGRPEGQQTAFWDQRTNSGGEL